MTEAQPPAGSQNHPLAKPEPVVDPTTALEDLVLGVQGLTTALNELDIFEKNNITMEEWAVVRVLIGRGQVAVRDVAQQAGVPRNRLRGLLSALQMKGLVTGGRAPAGKKETRADRIRATARVAGRKRGKAWGVFARAAIPLTDCGDHCGE